MTKRIVSIVICASVIAVGALALRARAAGGLTAGEARKVIAHLAGIQLPSDAVRVKEITALGNSAVVVAQVETSFRLVKNDQNQWQVAEIRTGDRRWEDVELLMKALDSEKTARARAELELIATALESYRRERGSYVEAKTEAALVDHLNPRFINRVIRVDPWHQPYLYEGTRYSFDLRSTGPDGKPNTADDVAVSGGTR